MKRIAVVGGGIAGCCASYALAGAGCDVELFEAGRIGAQGASSVPAALLNPHRGFTARAQDTDVVCLGATWQLVTSLSEAGFDAGARRCGVLRIAGSERQARLWRRRHDSRWLQPEAIPDPYHAPFGGLWIERGGWLSPSKLLACLRSAIEQAGAAVREGCRVLEVGPSARGVTLRTSETELAFDHAVLCTGTSTLSGVDLPGFERVAGDMVELESSVQLPYAVAGAVYGAQLGHSIFVGGNHRAAANSDPHAPQRLQQAFARFVRPLERAERRSVWTGVRAQPPGKTPIVREVAPNVWFLGALGGRGFLCAAHCSNVLVSALLKPS